MNHLTFRSNPEVDISYAFIWTTFRIFTISTHITGQTDVRRG
jgi:hypothetical protein